MIGAGISGLCAAKNSLDSGHDVTVLEQNAKVGGTWLYSDDTETNKYDMPVHSSMYKSLR